MVWFSGLAVDLLQSLTGVLAVASMPHLLLRPPCFNTFSTGVTPGVSRERESGRCCDSPCERRKGAEDRHLVDRRLARALPGGRRKEPGGCRWKHRESGASEGLEQLVDGCRRYSQEGETPGGENGRRGQGRRPLVMTEGGCRDRQRAVG